MAGKISVLEMARRKLEKHWGHKEFRKAQIPAIELILEGHDILAVLPTGGGKTVIFQVPALMKSGVTLVFSPLIALMKDQVDDANARGIPCSYINSNLDDTEVLERIKRLVDGEYKLFYVAPERIRSRAFMSALERIQVDYVVADEAHCVSRWGHDFRPSYMRIGELIERLSGVETRPQIIAVTATATPQVIEDIGRGLKLPDGYRRIIGDPVRPNLSYLVHRGNPWRALEELAMRWDVQNGRYIVYGTTRNLCEMLREILERVVGHGRTAFYHAGMNRRDRTSVQDAFKSGATPVVVATNAFGMGIDVPNIRMVIHFGIPGTLEDLLQESGRAGRDGLPGQCWLLANDRAVEMQQMFVLNANPPYALFEAVWRYLHDVIEPGSILRESAKRMVDSLTTGRYVGYAPMAGAVSSVLNMLESNGLVRRAYLPPGKQITLTPAHFLDAESEVEDAECKKVWKALRDSYVVPHLDATGEPPEERMHMSFDASAIARLAKLTQIKTGKALKWLNDAGIVTVEPTFRGKTTDIIKRDVDLREALPVAEIEEKRAFALRRLQLMVDYVTVPETERIEYIRSYFLRGAEALVEAPSA